MNILPPAAPGHPTNLTGNVQDETSVQLHWSKPNDPNGVILGYQVFYYGYKGNHTKVNTVNKCLIMSSGRLFAMVISYKCIYTSISPFSYTHIHIHKHIHRFIFIYVHTYIHICIRTYYI